MSIGRKTFIFFGGETHMPNAKVLESKKAVVEDIYYAAQYLLKELN